MKTLTYPRIGGKGHLGRPCPTALPVCVVPKPGYARKFAFFTTRYGGMDLRFQLDGQWLDTPAGIAHYLEHKMFDTADGSAMQGLARGRRRAQRLHQQRRHRLLFRLHRAFL